MTGSDTRRRWRTVTVLLVGLGALALCVAVPASAQSSEAPTVTNVTTNASDGNLTVTVTGESVSELDVENVPDEWTVQSHEDDFGSYANQLASEGRVLWLWPGKADVTVSVTFSVPENPTYELRVVPYAGTDNGEAVTVSAGVEMTPTDDANADQTPTEETTTPADASGGGATNDSSGESGPGFGVVATTLAVVGSLYLVRRR